MAQERDDREASAESDRAEGFPARGPATGDSVFGDGEDCLCPATGTIETLGRKYALQVFCAVGALDPARFGDLESAIPDASTSTLSDRLDEFEADGLIAREQYDEIPPRVEYELTDEGRELGERLAPLVEWLREREE